MEAIKTIDYKNYKINVYIDENPIAPNEWDNNHEYFLIYDHPNFTIKVKHFNGQEIFNHYCKGNKTYYGYYIFPVYAYIHSGVSLSLSNNIFPYNDKFDVSFKGFIFVGKSHTEKEAIEIAESLITEWNQYLLNDVYGYQILDSNNQLLESCWGFYGNKSIETIIIPECKSIIDHHTSKYGVQLEIEF